MAKETRRQIRKTITTMAKETRRQIIETTRNRVIRQYSNQMKLREQRIQILTYTNERLEKESISLKEENLKLKNQIEALEDWNRRLMEFMDIPEDQRSAYIENLKVKYQNDKKLQSIIKFTNTMFNYLNI